MNNMSKFAIGSRWEGQDEHRRYWIELRDIQEHPGHRYTEIWWAGWGYIGGEGSKSDWYTSYPMARETLYFSGRMKRIK